MASDALRRAAEAAFPGEEWDDDRLAGLKDLIAECSSSDYGSDDEDMEDSEEEEEDDMEDEAPPSSRGRKPKLDVGILFGPPPKKRR